MKRFNFITNCYYLTYNRTVVKPNINDNLYSLTAAAAIAKTKYKL